MMKTLTLNPRILPLVLGLLLIGGTACFAPRPMTPEEQAAMIARQKELQRAQLEKLEHDAGTGDLGAITSLANVYLHGYLGASRDSAKGLELLQKAAAASHTPAQVELGWILLAGRTGRANGQVEGLPATRNPDRGIALLKASLPGTTCAHRNGTQQVQVPSYFHAVIENDLSEIYRTGKLIPQDIEQANLWLERSLVHCQYPTATMLANPQRYGIVASPVDMLAWFMLLPPSPQLDAARSTARPDDIHAAEEKAVQLRQAVLQAETQYPAPH